MRSRVDLPEPEPPSRAKISPWRMVRLTSSTASMPSKRLLMRRISTRASPVRRPAGRAAVWFGGIILSFRTRPRRPAPWAAMASATGFHAVPDPGTDTLHGQGLLLGHVEVVHHLLVGVDGAVLEDLGVEELVGREVGVGIDHVLGDRRGHLGLEDEVDEEIGRAHV